MQVIEANHGLLTNIEVLELLRERRQQRNQPVSLTSDRQRIDSQHRLAIENKSLQYFEKNKITQYSLAELSEYLLELKESQIDLSEREIIQLVNLLPETDVEFYLILENCSERFTEEQVLKMKSLVESLKEKKRQKEDKQRLLQAEMQVEDIMTSTVVKTDE